MSFLDPLKPLVEPIGWFFSLGIYDVTIVVEHQGILVGERHYKKLMTYSDAIKMVRK